MAIVFFDDAFETGGATHTMDVAMGVAFHSACHALGIAEQSGPQTRTLARRIVALAQHGETDPIRLCDGALASLARRAPPKRSTVVPWRGRARRQPERRVPAA